MPKNTESKPPPLKPRCEEEDVPEVDLSKIDLSLIDQSPSTGESWEARAQRELDESLNKIARRQDLH